MPLNFLEETKLFMLHNGYIPADIVFIGSLDGRYQCSWGEFTDVANVDYEWSYGREQIASDLIIEFKDGSRLIRSSAGSEERWKVLPKLIRRDTPHKIKSFISAYSNGETLQTIHNYLLPTESPPEMIRYDILPTGIKL